MDYDTKSTAMDIDDTLAEPSPTANRICHNCQVPEFALSRPLSYCAKCNQTLYCSRTCQRADWKSHKKNCGKITTSPKSSPPPPPTANLNNDDDDNEEDEGEEEQDKPTLAFPLTTATRTTLPSLLLKTYLLRLYDEHRLDQRHHQHHDDDYDGSHHYERFQQFGPPSPPADTLLSAHGNPLRDYRRFLDRAEAAAAAGALALPAWYWGSNKAKKKKKEKENVGEARGDGGNSNNNISDMRRACEHLAKYGGLMIEGRMKRRVASLFESEMDLAMGQFELDHDEVMEEALRGLAVKICGTEVVWAGERS
ncbi:putative mynd domain [Diplodia seriata]|uniref:Putative mynd domain n=1 Tax=Diplodia seriata TaxID=420778 RepID=A0A0G2GIY8_9PEZI|nr:putative mynd domain [Diplodia seriata]